MKTLCVLGMGYIGLPTASMFATHNYKVIGVDVNRRVVDILSQGDVHIQEPGLKTLVQSAINSGHLVVSQQPQPADAFIIAVPTPLKNDSPSPSADLGYVINAAEAIAPCLKAGNLVILESTSPPGTTVKVVGPILERSGLKVGEDILLAHSPERVLPGRIMTELIQNDRVIGGVNEASSQAARDLYASFVEGKIFLTDATTAEMVKLIENTYRDVNIALANELALVAEHVGVNIWEAIPIANRHPRVNILMPGPGVGGHCIAVDPWFIVEQATETTPLIQQARKINDSMPEHVVETVLKAVNGIDRPIVAALGLAYKANVDDTRESPAVDIVKLLAQSRCCVRAFDPYVEQPVIEGLVDSLAVALEGADVLLLLVNHDQFKLLQPEQVKKVMRHHTIVDTRNFFKADAWQATGFEMLLLGSSRKTS